MRKPGLEQGGTGPRTSARRQWSLGTGWTPNSSLNSLLSQEGTAHLVPSLGQGWGWVSGLGCVGSRTQKAQCLPRPLQPGPALFWERGGCPAPGWAKRATCDIHAHRGPAPVLDPPAPPPRALTLTGCDKEIKLCLHFGLMAPALSWHPLRPKALQLALL